MAKHDFDRPHRLLESCRDARQLVEPGRVRAVAALQQVVVMA